MKFDATWTEDRIKRLTELWQAGYSGSTIGAALGGISRSAVIAKVHRLGLPGRKTKVNGRKSTKTKLPRRRREKPLRPVKIDAAPEVPVEIDDTVFVSTKENDIPGVKLLDLQSHMCRWPLGDPQSDDFRFCGKRKVFGFPYCEEHIKIAYQPIRRKVDVKPFMRESQCTR